jgi:hypothetical protein
MACYGWHDRDNNNGFGLNADNYLGKIRKKVQIILDNLTYDGNRNGNTMGEFSDETPYSNSSSDDEDYGRVVPPALVRHSAQQI